jgi:hypothetical protein
MKNATDFVSVEEMALETVAGGLLDVANYAVNGNCINVLSGISLHAVVGDVASKILNIANEIG